MSSGCLSLQPKKYFAYLSFKLICFSGYKFRTLRLQQQNIKKKKIKDCDKSKFQQNIELPKVKN